MGIEGILLAHVERRLNIDLEKGSFKNGLTRVGIVLIF